MSKAVFVYGTLKVGGRLAGLFDPKRKDVKRGKIQGRMFNVMNSYPAVVASDTETVIGELHYYDDGEAVTEAMDGVEGFLGKDDPTNLYNREKVTVTLDNGEEVQAEAYLFNRSVDGYETVAGGYWPV